VLISLSNALLNSSEVNMGESTLSPPKIEVTRIIFLQLHFLVIYEHHILDYFCFFKVYMINFKLSLINYFEKSNKHWRIWTYGIYLWKKIPTT
jgi:hypothetical protein